MALMISSTLITRVIGAALWAPSNIKSSQILNSRREVGIVATRAGNIVGNYWISTRRFYRNKKQLGIVREQVVLPIGRRGGGQASILYR